VRPHFDGFSAHGPAYRRGTIRDLGRGRPNNVQADHPIPAPGHSICRLAFGPQILVDEIGTWTDRDALLSVQCPVGVSNSCDTTYATVGFPSPLENRRTGFSARPARDVVAQGGGGAVPSSPTMM
jgi:hypothetical protein